LRFYDAAVQGIAYRRQDFVYSDDVVTIRIERGAFPDQCITKRDIDAVQHLIHGHASATVAISRARRGANGRNQQ